MAEIYKTEQAKTKEALEHAQVYRKAERPAAPVEISADARGAMNIVAQLTVGKTEGFANSILGASQTLETQRKAGDPGTTSTQLLYAALDALEGLGPKKNILAARPQKTVQS